MPTEKTPTVVVVRDGDQYVFFCEHCQAHHRHGASSLGHRTAHCDPDGNSPYRATGYCLSLAVGIGECAHPAGRLETNPDQVLCLDCGALWLSVDQPSALMQFAGVRFARMRPDSWEGRAELVQDGLTELTAKVAGWHSIAVGDGAHTKADIYEDVVKRLRAIMKRAEP